MIRFNDQVVLGLSEHEFQKVLYNANCLGYVVARDGNNQRAPDGYMANRILVGTTNGQVTKVYGWG